jgi:hypothetical protein
MFGLLSTYHPPFFFTHVATMDPAFADEEVEAGAAGDDGLAYLWRDDI